MQLDYFDVGDRCRRQFMLVISLRSWITILILSIKLFNLNTLGLSASDQLIHKCLDRIWTGQFSLETNDLWKIEQFITYKTLSFFWILIYQSDLELLMALFYAVMVD